MRRHGPPLREPSTLQRRLTTDKNHHPGARRPARAAPSQAGPTQGHMELVSAPGSRGLTLTPWVLRPGVGGGGGLILGLRSW